MASGEIEIELVPQGTIAERIRAAGCGLGGFYTPTGVGTIVATNKESRIIDGREYLLELPLKADYALIRAYKADKFGNLSYRGVMRNFNAVMAMAAGVTIVQVQEIVEPGELDPNIIATPQIFVDRIVRIPKGEIM
jgi:3-oxoacid CoA-transferase A subunit